MPGVEWKVVAVGAAWCRPLLSYIWHQQERWGSRSKVGVRSSTCVCMGENE